MTSLSVEAENLSVHHLKRLKKRRAFFDNLTLFLLTLPGLAFLLLFNYAPMFGVVIAFKKYQPLKGIFGSEWIGLDNFRFFFNSQDALRTIRNTVLYAVDFLILDLVLGVLMALLLYHLHSKVMLKTYHTIILLPRFLSIVIISFMVYALLSPSYGVLNQIIQAFGGQSVQWYSDSLDWKENATPDSICKRVTSKVKNGSIVLFHNDADHTPEALPTILKCLKDDGYEFVFISDLIYKDNYEIKHDGTQCKKDG